MAIKLEFCNVIIPVKHIKVKLGEDTFANQYSAITDICWHDEHLWREGCMDDYALSEVLDEWKARGFQALTVIDGQKNWQDLCVVNSHHGPSYPCEWIEYDPHKNIAWLKGQAPGCAVGPLNRPVAGED